MYVCVMCVCEYVGRMQAPIRIYVCQCIYLCIYIYLYFHLHFYVFYVILLFVCLLTCLPGAGTGYISFDEFCDIVKRKIEDDDYERELKEMFRALDTEKRGEVNTKELR